MCCTQQHTHNCFGTLLSNLRIKRKMPQKQLALSAGLDQSYLSAIERGARPPPRDEQLSRLLSALQASDGERLWLYNARFVYDLQKCAEKRSWDSAAPLSSLLLLAAFMEDEDVQRLLNVAQAMCKEE